MKKICMRATAALLSLSILYTPALAFKGTVIDPEELPYIAVDGSPSNWAVEEVESALNMNLIPDLTGEPDYQDNITREQFAELVVQTVSVALDKELPSAPSGTFSDSTNPAVLQASEAGIVNGVEDGKFDPKATTNREQIATMIARGVEYIAEQSGVDLAPLPGSLDGFSDKTQVSSWAAEGVGILAANGIMTGTSDTELSPHDPCTVEQSVLLLYRVFEKFVAASN